jgi:Phage integrase family
MKSASKKRAPSIVNLTVKRRYLTEREVERLMDCARKHGRYGHRDATMIMVAYRHGLRASEVCDLHGQLSEGRLHVHRVMGFPACTRSAVTRCGLCASYAAITPETLTSSFPSNQPYWLPPAHPARRRGCQECHSQSTPTCFAMPAGSSSPTMATTRGRCSTTSGTRTSSIRSGTPKWRPTGSRTFGEADLRPWASWCRRFGAPASSGRLPLPLQSPWHSPPLPAWQLAPGSALWTVPAAHRSSP